MTERRKDSKGRVLKENEIQRNDGSYMYRWRTTDHKRHTIYAPTLEELREKEQKVLLLYLNLQENLQGKAYLCVKKDSSILN